MPRDPMISIRGAITRFAGAAQDHAFKGAAHPQDHAAIDEKYASTREALERLIQKAIYDLP